LTQLTTTYYDQNQIKDIAKGGLVSETTFNLHSPATSNNQSFILISKDSTLKKSRPQKILTLFDALDEREIAR
jgi:hypothetical protein